jgi:diguanylate cyclase (GGDEF)-like protein/PAS domain S-box-containing protein
MATVATCRFRFDPTMQERNYTPLAAHFLRRFLSVYLAFSVVGLAAMAVVEYQRQRARVMDVLHSLTATFGPVLGHAVWDYQNTAVTAIVHGIAQDPDVVEVQVPAAPGFASRRERSPAGGTPSERVRVEVPLTIPGEAGATQRVGTLIIASSEQLLWKHVALGLASTATVMGAVLLLAALAMWVLVRRLLVDPLTRLSEQLQKESLLSSGAARRLPRFAGREFAVLRLRFILLLRDVARAQADLRQSHALLEERVDARTQELSQVLEFNAAILRNSPVPMGVYASNGDCVAANDAYARFVGAKREDLLAQNFLHSPAWKASPLQGVCVEALALQMPRQGEVRVRTSFGKEVYFEYQIFPTLLGGQDHLLIQFTDLTERQRLEEELRQLAFQDALTLLPNRRLLLDRLDQAIRASRRHGSHLAVVFIDLNKFKLLNDTYGHEVGDKLLIIVADRLRAMVRGSDAVARLGGDEFVVLSTDLGSSFEEATRNAMLIADKIRVSMAEPCLIAGVTHACSASVGVKLFSGDESDADTILRQADAAMYRDKKAARPAPVAR